MEIFYIFYRDDSSNFLYKRSLKTNLVGLLSAVYSYMFFAGLADGKARYKETLVTSLVPLLTYFLFMIIFRTKATMKQVVALSMGTATYV